MNPVPFLRRPALGFCFGMASSRVTLAATPTSSSQDAVTGRLLCSCEGRDVDSKKLRRQDLTPISCRPSLGTRRLAP